MIETITDDLNCDSQDLALHTVMSDGVATVSRALGGANKRRTLALSPGYVNYPDSSRSLGFPL